MNLNQELISIIIPVFNRAHLILETLDSIATQTYTNFECILIDDTSTDDSFKFITAYTHKDKRFQLLRRPEYLQKGANSCRNYGRSIAQGSYIQFFDSDDLMHPNNLELKIETLKNSSFTCVASNFNFFRNQLHITEKIEGYNHFDLDTLKTDFIGGKIVLCLQSILWRSAVLRQVVFDEKLSYAEDIDVVFQQMLQPNFKMQVIDTSLVYIRKHDNSLTHNFKSRNVKLIYDEISVRKKIFQFTIHDKKSIFKTIDAFKMYLKALRNLCYINAYRTFFNHSFYILKNVNNNLKFVLLKVNVYVLFYIFTKRGLTAYKNDINAL